jgi:hypothetical protein
MPTCARWDRRSPSDTITNDTHPPKVHMYMHHVCVKRHGGEGASCVGGYDMFANVNISGFNTPRWKEKDRVGTFFMMGSTASVLLDEDDAAARPFGMCESGTRMGLCRRIDRFFCDLPMAELRTFCDFRAQSISRASEWMRLDYRRGERAFTAGPEVNVIVIESSWYADTKEIHSLHGINTVLPDQVYELRYILFCDPTRESDFVVSRPVHHQYSTAPRDPGPSPRFCWVSIVYRTFIRSQQPELYKGRSSAALLTL